MQEFHLKLDLRWVVGSLLLVIALMLGLWQPWQPKATGRTITVTGEGTIAAAPDEFSFQPYYQASGQNSKDALNKTTEKGNQVVGRLKELGVKEDQIKTQVSSSGYYTNDYEGPIGQEDIVRYPSGNTATFSLTITVDDKDLAQKVLDYLVTTDSVTGVFPISSFKDDTRTKLELEARKKALENAKDKAKQTARELGARIGKVVKISELDQFKGPVILDRIQGAESDTQKIQRGTSAPTLLTGTEELSFTITVEYELK